MNITTLRKMLNDAGWRELDTRSAVTKLFKKDNSEQGHYFYCEFRVSGRKKDAIKFSSTIAHCQTCYARDCDKDWPKHHNYSYYTTMPMFLDWVNIGGNTSKEILPC